MSLVSSSRNMIAKQCITLIPAILLGAFVLTLAKHDCGQSQEDSSDDEVYKFLSFIKPLRYQVYLDPCISDGNFSGYAHIDLLVLKPTKNLTLHSHELQFCEDGVYLTLKGSLNQTYLKPLTGGDNESNSFSDEMLDDSSETTRPSGFMYHKKEQTVTMKFDDFLKPGRYSLEINYMGTINPNCVGVYRKTYKDTDGENRVMLLTNLHPTSARRVFPCRDDPAIKAEVYFTMQTSLNYTTITASNPGNFIEFKEGQRWTHYRSFKNISTYQLNFAVLSNIKNFTKVHANRTYTTYAATGDLKSIKLAQDVHEKAMVLMEGYTKMCYPLNTFVNLVIPEKVEITSSSSLGFITTRKSHILYNERSGPQKKKDVIMQSLQNVVNQWFNHLVSPASWKYMWLTDGLTNFMKYRLADQIMPNWRMKEMFAVWELQRRAFIPNKLEDSPPLNKNISNNPKDIECLLTRSFSSNSMSASLIRMMAHFLSDDILHAGIKNFLKHHKYCSVKPDDFYESIQTAVTASEDEKLKSINVKEIMETWTNTEFYPIVNVTRNYETGAIKVTQIPAVTFFELAEKNVTNKWWIPINFATHSNPDFNTTAPSHWLKPDMEHLEMEGVESKDWIIFNIQQTGYYRVLYDEENWKRLSSILNSEHYVKISPVNRAQILNDAVQFSLKRQLDMGTFLDIFTYLQRETDYVPWYDAQFIFSFLNYHLSNTKAYDSLRSFSLRLIAPLVDKIGYEDRPEDDYPTLLLRRISNHWACHFGYRNCWNNATKQLEAYLDDNKSELGSSDLQEWARCIGLNGANITIWNKMFKKYQDNMSEDTLIYLACSESSSILRSFLNKTVSEDSVIPEKHVLSVFKSVCLYPTGDDKRINLCLKFIDNKFDKIKSRFGNSTDSFTYLLDLLASEIRQKPQLDYFQKIISHERAAFAATPLAARLKQTESRISVFEQKANYYEPYFKEKIMNLKDCN